MAQYQYSNYTIFAIKNNGEKATLTVFNILILLSSLMGDSAILVASIRYKALKQHKMIEAVIQHLAVSDLTFSFTTVFPSITSILADKWSFGDTMCYIRANLGYILSVAAWFFIAVLCSSKLLILKFPFRAGTVSSRCCHQICGAIWCFGLIVPIIYISLSKDDVIFDYRTYVCIYGFSSDAWIWLKPLLTVFFSILPNLIVVITTIMLIIEARKVTHRAHERLRLQGIMIVVLTAVVYCLSVIPYTVYLIAAPHVKEDPPGKFHVQYFRVAACCLLFNTVSNFYIYTLTLTSFRKFLWDRCRAVIGSTLSSFDSQADSVV